jgi:predicted acyltransferase
MTDTQELPVRKQTTSLTSRVLSVDVLRGITIAFMILVNDPGDGKVGYWPLEHADWNGWTPTDLVFPTFLFLVGCSIVFSIGSRLRAGTPKKRIVWQAAKRSFWILVINYALRLLPDFKNLTHIRFYGVLPRIAVVYFFATLIYLVLPRARDLAIACSVALIGYYVLLRWVPIPGAGIPGQDVPFMDQYNNLTAYVDRGFLHWTVKYLHTGSLYNKYRDPEGLLSTLPSIGTSLLGILAGMLLRSKESAKRVRNALALGGIAGIALGLLWNIWFPVNKNLWTSSFVLLAAGIAALLLAICYEVYDVAQWQHRSPLVRRLSWPWIIFGSNAIAAYVLSGLYGKIMSFIPIQDGEHIDHPFGWLYQHVFAHWGSTANTSLAFAIFYVVLCFIPVWILWRRGIFLRV